MFKLSLRNDHYPYNFKIKFVNIVTTTSHRTYNCVSIFLNFFIHTKYVKITLVDSHVHKELYFD